MEEDPNNSKIQFYFSREKTKKLVKARDTYGLIYERMKNTKANHHQHAKLSHDETNPSDSNSLLHPHTNDASSNALVPMQNPIRPPAAEPSSQLQLIPKKAPSIPKPKWHAPWKLYRVISGHLGWVRCVAVEPGNEWFATGAADRVIKIWDLASGKLRLSLTGMIAITFSYFLIFQRVGITSKRPSFYVFYNSRICFVFLLGHVSTVRGLAVSPKHPYLFSCGEDRQVKCWDLEYNKVSLRLRNWIWFN